MLTKDEVDGMGMVGWCLFWEHRCQFGFLSGRLREGGKRRVGCAASGLRPGVRGVGWLLLSMR